MALGVTLKNDLTANGMDQGDLFGVISNLVDAVNELITDHATMRTQLVELNVDADAVFVDLTAIRAAIVGITAKLDADAGITDTDYASTWDPAALTATAIAAADVATLTNNDTIVLTGS